MGTNSGSFDKPKLLKLPNLTCLAPGYTHILACTKQESISFDRCCVCEADNGFIVKTSNQWRFYDLSWGNSIFCVFMLLLDLKSISDEQDYDSIAYSTERMCSFILRSSGNYTFLSAYGLNATLFNSFASKVGKISFQFMSVSMMAKINKLAESLVLKPPESNFTKTKVFYFCNLIFYIGN